MLFKKEEIMNRLILILLAFISLHASAKHQKMNLGNALGKKLVKATALSAGGYQDYCMNMNLKNLSDDSLIVIVEAGRRLNSLEESDQDILITHEEIIVLKKHEDKWFKVKGFCCQANNHSPRLNAKYHVNTLADSGLVTLARYLSSGTFDAHVAQQAVWAISDKKPTAQIADQNDSLLLPLRQLVSAIKGEPLPWFSIISKTYVFPSGTMVNYPQYLRGKLNYSNDKDCYTTLHVLDERGIEVCQIIKQWTLTGNRDLNLNIPVKGLAKGKYTVELKTENKELAKREFEI
jgi:hypothetical protein